MKVAKKNYQKNAQNVMVICLEQSNYINVFSVVKEQSISMIVLHAV